MIDLLCKFILRHSRYIEIPNRNGDGLYLARWIPFKIPGLFAIYIHQFHESDDDSAFHDHPWPFLHIILSGSYTEHNAEGSFVREEGYWGIHRPLYLHRVELIDDEKTWTVTIRGPRLRVWGFNCPVAGWIPWTEHMDNRDNPDFEC